MRKTVGLALLVSYVGVIVAANFAVNRWGLVPVGFGLVAPAAVYFVGLAFTLRDLAQEALGRRPIVVAILVGAVLSYVVAVLWPSGNPFVSAGRLALASAVAFLLSELADYEVYTPLRERGWLRAVVLSNIVGLVVDSLLFLGIAFGSLHFLWGQLVGKAIMTGLAVALLAALREQRPPVPA